MIRHLILSACLIAIGPVAYAKTSAAPAVVTANKAAIREPDAAAYRNAVQLYPYAEGALYRLYTAPGRVSDIALQPGENLTSVAAGDTARWTLGDTVSGSGAAQRTHILVKPFSSGLSTNLVIATDRRVYHVQLTSTASTAMAAIGWTYPDDELLALARQRAAGEAIRPVSVGVAVENLEFGYAISGDRPAWRPVRAFDDGRQTWIEFSEDIATGEAPPLFIRGEEGEAELVNYRVSGRFYIVDRLFAVAELRLGGKKQKIVRITRTGKAPTGRGRGR
ncbi:P-type conjugative transfer protein TrbG [Sphingopyxis sp. MWB1]|uniref:P-type conjugative transfer protein TrbG n=1 Tax=Sphingopyxis sp. MWB1 TaxID=1537715 RepID=UPI000519FB7C|nr:P-type conjugative transfer protein TrbG [Sphingopyxis sp. MWB1]